MGSKAFFRSRRLLSFLFSSVFLLSLLTGCGHSAFQGLEETLESYQQTFTSYERSIESYQDTIESYQQELEVFQSEKTSPPVDPAAVQPAAQPALLPVNEGETLTVHFLDVGQGQATLFKQGDYEILIDGGGQSSSRFVVAYLKELGVEEIELMVATHFDEDHIAGLIGVLNVFPVRQVLCGSNPKDTRVCNSFVNTLQTKQLSAAVPISVGTPHIGDRFAVGSMELNVIGPLQYGNSEYNDDSIVSTIKFGENAFVIGGDTTNEMEKKLINQDLKADLTLANHHGSKGSNSSAWLEKIAPNFVVISCGRDNSYGHPSDEALTRIKAAGADVYRTDELGTILFECDGQTVRPVGVKAETSEEGEDAAREASQDETEEAETTAAEVAAETGDFVLNTNSKKFHRPGCGSVNQMKAANRQNTNDSRDSIISRDYQPCKKCNP